MIDLIAAILLYGCLGAATLAIGFYILHESLLRWRERRLRTRARRLAGFLEGLADQNAKAFESVLKRFATLKDLDALEYLLEERRRTLAPESPPQEVLRLYESYDRLGIVGAYIKKLERGKRWAERAFAAEFLGELGNARAVEPLVAVMRNTREEDRDVRMAASRALGKIRDPRAIPPLIEALSLPEAWLPPRIAEVLLQFGDDAFDPLVERLRSSTEPTIRVWAAEILGELGNAKALPHLLTCLTDLNDQVRARAASSLGKLGDRRAVGELISMMLADPVPFVRIQVVRALGEIGDPRALHHLIDSLHDGEWWVRIRVVEALEQLGEVAIDPLFLSLEDDDAEVRKRAALTLERLGVLDRLVEKLGEGDVAAREKLVSVGQAGVVEVLIAALEDGDSVIRLEMARILGEVKAPTVSHALIECLDRETDPEVRAAAISSLAQLKEERAAEAITRLLGYPHEGVRAAAVAALDRIPVSEPNRLLGPMVHDPDPTVRRGAARVLGRVGTRESSPILQGLLRDCDPGVRVEAATSLGLLQAEDAVDVLIEAFRDYDPKVQLAAARSLGQVGSPRCLTAMVEGLENASEELMRTIAWSIGKIEWSDPEALIDELFRGGDRRSRLGVIAALGRVDSEPGNALVRSMLEDRDDEVVRCAVETIGEHRDEEALETLHVLMRSPSEAIRTGVLDALGKIRSRESLPVITAALEDPTSRVRARAALALGHFADRSAAERLWVMLDESPDDPKLAPPLLLALMAMEREEDLPRFLGAIESVPISDYLAAKENRADPVLRSLVDGVRSSDSIEYLVATTWDRRDLEESLIREVRTSRNETRRVKAIRILTHFDSQAAFPAVWRAFYKDPAESVRIASIEYLKRQAPPEELFRALIDGIADINPRVQVASLGELRAFPWDQSVPVLLKNIDSEDPLLRQTLVEHLATLPAGEIHGFLDVVLGGDPSTESRTLAVRVVARAGLKEAGALLEGFLTDSEVAVRREVLRSLSSLPGRSLPRLVTLARDDPDEGVRLAAVDAAASLGRKRGAEVLAGFLEDPSPRVRRQGVLALARSPADSREKIRPLVRDPSGEVRAAALAALILLGEEGVERRLTLDGLRGVHDALSTSAEAEELERALISSRTVKERTASLRALFVLGGQRRSHALAQARLDPSKKVRTLGEELEQLLDRWLLDPSAAALLDIDSSDEGVPSASRAS